ncbi:hypothetical protein INT45_008877 [Circinella minor]|uniref:Major facilitator superfamily (MFS) profile domain-containing protein n=1 Tax=Circinella minor TaxID=1195481 RepID=A0A8H7VE76_9FUNG|nr:hypothetical protein INT45_008877 [Circinella minor]
MTLSQLKQLFKSRLSIRPPVDGDPRLFSSRTKYLVIVILAMCAASSGFSSTIYFPGIPEITLELNSTPIATTLTAALFILFMGLTPVVWAALSDYYRIRRFLLILSMVIFGLASLGSALVNNIWGLVILRCVQASGASCGQSVGAGIIADCYPIERRGAAFGKYFFGVFFGPVLGLILKVYPSKCYLGPILGGFLIMSNLTWRTAFWFCLAFSCTVLVLILFTYPETYRDNEKWDTVLETGTMDVNSEKTKSNNDQYLDLAIQIPMEEDQYVHSAQSQSIAITTPSSTPKSNGARKKKTFNPIKPFQYFRHPHVLLASLIVAFVFGSMFVLETILPILFERIYGFSSWQIGLSYLGGGVGNIFGAVINTFLSDHLLLRARAKRGGRASVEDRIGINVWPSLFVFMPFGLLLFGWSLDKKMSFWAGIVGFGLVNFAMNQTVTSLSAYLVDSAPNIGASFTACANFARMIMACILTIASNPLVDAIGPGLTCVFLTGLTVIAMILLIILKIFGGQFRYWSGYQQKNELKQHI